MPEEYATDFSEFSVLVWDCSMHLVYANSKAIGKQKLTYEKHGNITGVQSEPIEPILNSSRRLSGEFLGIQAVALWKSFFAKELGILT